MTSETSPANDENKTLETLISRALEGDKNSYTLFLKQVEAYARPILYSSLASPEWVDDVIQEILLSVHKALPTFERTRPVKPWLNAIINFRKTDYLRRHYRQRKLKQEAQLNVETEHKNVTFFPDTPELKDMERALAQIPKKQRDVLILMKIKGYTAKEVSRQLGMSVSAVKVSAHRGAASLRKIMEVDDE
jgi:RNA polymerase sigma-70 factor (ECF subfamily)